MKILATVSTAAIAAMLSASSQAADLSFPQQQVHQPLSGISAVLSMWAAFGHPDHDSNSGDFDDGYINFGGSAAVAGDMWQLEIDASAHTSTDDDSSSEGSQYVAFGAHYLNRGDVSTWGLFGAASAASIVSSDENTYHLFGGAEYAYFRANQTYFVQGGGIFSIGGDTQSTWQHGGFVRGGLRHFFSEDAMLTAEGTIGFGPFSSSETGVYGAWGLEYERQISGGPFSWQAFYRGAYVEDSGSSTANTLDHVFGLGVTVTVNRDSLLERDRTGASTFDLPQFHKAVSWPGEV